MYNLVMFDLDGTILNSSKGIEKSITHCLKKISIDFDANFKNYIGPPIETLFKNVIKLNDEQTVEASKIFREVYKTKYLFDAELYDGIINAINKLKEQNIICCVVTNKRLSYTKTLLEHFNIYNLFNAVYGTDENGALSKADLIKNCLKDFNIKNKDAVMIGDATSDSSSANVCNVSFLPVTYGFGFKNKDDVKNIKKIGVASTPIEILNFIL